MFLMRNSIDRCHDHSSFLAFGYFLRIVAHLVVFTEMSKKIFNKKRAKDTNCSVVVGKKTHSRLRDFIYQQETNAVTMRVGKNEKIVFCD